jgi:hypothetical protein
MGLLLNVFLGLAVVTAGAAVAALVGWYYTLDSYGEYMSERAHRMMKFGVPPMVLLSAAPVLDVALWLVADFPFPTIGFGAPAVGLVGGVGLVSYVALDIRRTMSVDAGGPSLTD